MAADDIASEIFHCANRDCLVAIDKKCVEGLTLDTCPHFGHDPEPEEDKEAAAATLTPGIALRAAYTLSGSVASELLRALPARVVAIIGPFDSGKTSLIASLYDLFQNGPVGGVDFATSQTLQAFEQTCHDARAASKRAEPHFDRTPLGDVHYYHLGLGGGAAGPQLALLLADRAGETYRSAVDDISIVAEFAEVSRADTITALVDGERLLDASARHNVRSEIQMIIQALFDGGAVTGGQRLALVLTKADLISNSPFKARVDADFKGLVASAQQLFGDGFSTVGSFEVAASPKDTTLERGTGVSALLDFWLRPRDRVKHVPISPLPVPRLFGRLPPTYGDVQ